MTPAATNPAELNDTLRALYDAAADRLRAEVKDEASAHADADERFKDAAHAAITAGDTLSMIAEAEDAGAAAARADLGPEALKTVKRLGGRYRAAEQELTEAVQRAMRLGYAQRELARETGLRPAALRTLLSPRSAVPLVPAGSPLDSDASPSEAQAVSADA